MEKYNELLPFLNGENYGDTPDKKMYLINGNLGWLQCPQRQMAVVYGGDPEPTFADFLKEYFYKKDRDKLDIVEINLDGVSLSDAYSREAMSIHNPCHKADVLFTEYRMPDAKDSPFPNSPFAKRSHRVVIRNAKVIRKGTFNEDMIKPFIESSKCTYIRHQLFEIDFIALQMVGCGKRKPELYNFDGVASSDLGMKPRKIEMYYDDLEYSMESDRKFSNGRIYEQEM